MKKLEAVKFLCKSTALKLRYFKSPKVMNSEQTIDYIVKNKCSIARFGDGELSLIEKRSIKFQNYNSQLAKKLQEVKTNSKCLVCIPNIFDKKYFNKNIIVKDEYVFWKYAKLLFGGMWNKLFAKQEPIGDAFITRFYIRYKDKSKVKTYIEKLKTIWNNKNIILVEGKTSQIGVSNDLLNNAKSIRRIICPNANAFDFYDKIKNSVQLNYHDGDLVMLALGPTATALAFDLSNSDIWALDMGHFDIEYEWYLAKTDKKIPVKNKHVQECNQMGTQTQVNEDYIKQIIQQIE